MQKIDLSCTNSEKERRDNEQFRQQHQLDDQKFNIFLEMKKLVKKELETNADVQGQNIEKITDPKHLLRQLNARDFNIEKTIEMWRSWIQWRKKFDMDNICLETIESEMKTGKAFWHKYDKQGNPCCIVRIKNHIAAETTHDKVIKFMIYLMEVGIKMSEKSGTEKMCVIWDREGFSSKNFDFQFITLMKSLVAMFQDNYAERLAQVYILYPSFLMRQAFNIFKPLLAEKVRNKIQIINELSDLQKFFDEQSILKIHGGKSDFEYKYPDNILSDPLNAVLPYIPSRPNLNINRNQSFSFQNSYNQGEIVSPLNRSSNFFSIENDSTEFFNIQNSQEIDYDEEPGSQSQSSSNFQDLQNQFKTPEENSPQNLQNVKNQQVYHNQIFKEDEVLDQFQNHSPKKIADQYKYNHQNHENNQVVTSGCCGCKSGSSCSIF
ncbi:hypothetical protein ABPG74_019987 [Tetrahymena malaccensis]